MLMYRPGQGLDLSSCDGMTALSHVQTQSLASVVVVEMFIASVLHIFQLR